jgi:methyltransferase
VIGAADSAPRFGLALFLAVLAAQRVGELVHSAHNVRGLRLRGAREYAAGHFPLLVVVHVLFPLCIVAEVVFFGTRPGPLWPAALALYVAAQALRYSAVRALGGRWSVGIWVLPGEPLVRRGPYRFLRHPNYVAVVTELAAAPLMFGAWRTALAISLLNALALSIRIREEEAALREALGGTAASIPEAPGVTALREPAAPLRP